MQFEASKVLHEDGNHGKAVDSQYVAHHLAPFITEIAEYDMIKVHFSYRHEGKVVHQAGSPDILVHVVATYDAF